MNLTYVNGLNFEWVKSHYHSRWKGVIIGRYTRPIYNDILILLIIYDKSNHLMKKRQVRTLDESWTEKILPIDVNIIENWTRV